MSRLLTELKSLETDEAQRLAEIERCRRDRIDHITRHIKIKDKPGNIRLLSPLKFAQRKLAAVLHACRHTWFIPARILIFKSRKVGMSTYVLADMFLEVLEHGYDAMVIAHDVKASEYLFAIQRRAYDGYDLQKPELQRSNKKELKFQGREGFIETQTANSISAARSRTPQYVLSSEGAFWTKGAEYAISLVNAIPKELTTTHVIETTPNMEDPFFYPRWTNAVECCTLSFDAKLVPSLNIKDEDKWNGFIPLYIGATEDEDCRIEMKDDEKERFVQTLNDYEHGLVKAVHASPEFLKWRRRKIAEDFGTDPKMFNQEHSSTWQEGILASGRPRFDIDKLNLMPVEDGQLGYLDESKSWDHRINFTIDKSNFLTVFRSPQRGHRYVIGVDVSEGLLPEGAARPDSSVGIVVDLDEGAVPAQVATLCGQISEEYLFAPLRLLGEWYGMAFIVPEISGGYGGYLLNNLTKAYPPELIYHRLDSTGRQMGSDTLGWKTHEGNRNLLINELASQIVNGTILIRDRRTLDECKGFKFSKGGKPQAGPGKHDDHVFALALAAHGITVYPRDRSIDADDLIPPWQRKMDAAFRIEQSEEGKSKITGY